MSEREFFLAAIVAPLAITILAILFAVWVGNTISPVS